ncbi:helix-turn-helix domain-containing protein [Lachnoclostridium edouardi]|uniref:helix-turn-helix domain-containing protein n=1 Tax=Lachnoclostridium edouardi TaxID=1926283 RepID=UPI000C7C7D6D|nr:helix-turn-helix transcriptional regulator [Lachnoclostridium edouardi]
MITYDKLWTTMKRKGITQYMLIKKYGISNAQIWRMRQNQYVSTHTIEVFCRILECGTEDIMEFKK